MRLVTFTGALVAGAIVASTLHATAPNTETRRWWGHVEKLAGDAMRGRDTGSPEHRRAAEYVARQLEASGVGPAGEAGYFQPVPLHDLRLRPEQSTAVLTRDGRSRPLRWLQHITVTPAAGLPDRIDGDLIFIGSDNGAGIDTANRIVVRLNPVRLVAGPPEPAPPPGVAAVVGIDSAGGPEPARWPAQYAVTMTLADTPIARADGPVTFRFNPAFADALFEGTGHTYQDLLDRTARGDRVPSFPLRASLRLTMRFDAHTLSSDNVIGVFPGGDATLSSQYVVLSAHLDGYGVGEPWNGDRIYNGAFDDAAYVATLLDFAGTLQQSRTRLRRSLLFAIVTGEEKGLLGSRYYTQHLTVPRARLVANVNLDQLRPVFPLRILTMHAIDDSTLVDIVRPIASAMDITIQKDPEPLRNLMRRSDNFSFMQIGIPATGFVFGYRPGSPEEAAYRRWYADRYHTPKDDLSQPWDPAAAAKFNEFFARIVAAIANADEPPRWTPESPFTPRP